MLCFNCCCLNYDISSEWQGHCYAVTVTDGPTTATQHSSLTLILATLYDLPFFHCQYSASREFCLKCKGESLLPVTIKQHLMTIQCLNGVCW